MQRYFVTPEQLAEVMVVLTGDDAHHIGACHADGSWRYDYRQ